MKLCVLVCVAAVAVVVEASPFSGQKLSYHESYGIPMAARLKELEKNGTLSRIVGGTSVPLGRYPFMVGIVIELDSPWPSMCGASLLSNTRSLTAAHCWYDGWRWALSFEMVFGSRTLHTGGVRIRTTDVEMHSGWDTVLIHNDIALVRHARVNFNNIISPIRLPTGQQSNDFVGTWAVAVGYGKTFDAQIPTFNPDQREANLQVISNVQCQQNFGQHVIPSTLCTLAPRGTNICSGDSGGPLITGTGENRFLIGVISFGSYSCEEGRPAGYARVTSFTSWIASRA